MKALITVLMLCVAVGLLVAGCTTPVTVTPTPTTTATPQPTATTPVTDPALAGSWTLGEMGLQGGKAPLTVFPQPITITITISATGNPGRKRWMQQLWGNLYPDRDKRTVWQDNHHRPYCSKHEVL